MNERSDTIGLGVMFVIAALIILGIAIFGCEKTTDRISPPVLGVEFSCWLRCNRVASRGVVTNNTDKVVYDVMVKTWACGDTLLVYSDPSTLQPGENAEFEGLRSCHFGPECPQVLVYWDDERKIQE